MQLYVCILSSIQLISMLFDYLILSGLDFDTLTYASLKKSIIDQNKALWYLHRNVPKISKKYMNTCLTILISVPFLTAILHRSLRNGFRLSDL